MNQELIELYQQLADLTAPACQGIGPGACKLPRKCCEKLYCELAEDYALETYDIKLEHTDHPTIPFMGENGCTVPPHLRPLCTFHTCKINSIGFTEDPDYNERYFNLRQRIYELHDDQ